MKRPGILNPAFKSRLLDPHPHLTLSIYGFSGNDSWQFSPPTRNIKVLQDGMKKLARFGGGNTFLYPAVDSVLRALDHSAQTTHMMVIFSDALSNDLPRDAAIQLARTLAITLNPVLEAYDRESLDAFTSRSPPEKRQQIGERVRTNFKRLAQATGGIAFEPSPKDKDPLPAILQALSDELEHEYIAGVYLPSGDDARRAHSLRVKLRTSETGELRGGYRIVADH